MAGRTDDATATYGPATDAASPERPSYVLVLEGGTSVRVPLPATGTAVIGRAVEADVRLRDVAASRRHAELITRGGEITICDQGSHNGTRVNGERIAGSRGLASGDVVAIGDAILVVYPGGDGRTGRRFLDPAQVRQRLDEEIERAASFERPLGVACFALGTGAWDRDAVLRVIDGGLRRIDLVGELTQSQIVWIAPETDREALVESVAGLVATLARIAPGVRAGFATCPADGCQAGSLLAAARAAAALAGPGAVHDAADCATTMKVGDRTIVVADPAMIQIYELIRHLAQSQLAVLVTGETGTGKENAAHALHAWSARAGKPVVALNCAAMQETLVESELFGHEKGAFSGAAATKPGLLETADGGTVFLDEIGELSLAIQAKILRVLEDSRFTRVGALRDRKVDIRIVAATNAHLEDQVKAGRFRQDLFFRLAGATVILPPLRERPRELAVLSQRFLDEARAGAGAPAMTISAAAMRLLAAYAWPGNIRELRNTMSFSAATTTDAILEPWHLPERITGNPVPDATDSAPRDAPSVRKFRALAEELRELERRRMQEALDAVEGHQRRAAELIGMPLRTFVMKLRQYGMRRSD